MPPTSRAIAALLALAACAPLSPEGEWTGQCLTDDAEARVRLRIAEGVSEDTAEDPDLFADVAVHLAERPTEFLHLTCDVDAGGREVLVDGCTGAWTTEEEIVADSFAVDGILRRDDPTDTLAGSCTFEDRGGDLDLVWTP